MLVCFCLAMNCLWASDFNQTTDSTILSDNAQESITISNDDSQIDELNVDSSLNVTKADSNSNNVGDDEDVKTYSFTDLGKLIKYSPDELVLDGDIVYNSTIDGDGLVISKNNYVIDFNGHSIDANWHAGTLLTVAGKNIVFKNLKFIKGKGTYVSGHVSASGTTFTFWSAVDYPILWTGDNGLIENCEFTNSETVLKWTGNDGVINNSYFHDSKYEQIYVDNNHFNLENTRFEKLSGMYSSQYVNGHNGYHVRFINDAKVKYCTFYDISEASLSGGYTELLYSNFTLTHGTVNINRVAYCIFDSVYRPNRHVYTNQAQCLLANTIEFCTLQNFLIPTTYHCAMICGGISTMIRNCTLINNKAPALFFDALGGIFNCTFIDNVIWEYTLGYNQKSSYTNAYFDGCTFINNGAVNEGGAIAVLGNDFYIYNCVFLNNSADAGVIFINTQYDQSKNFTINNNIFLNNNAVGIYFGQPESTGDVDYNWFGNNATNYNTSPITTNTNMTNWLFLNTTYCPDILLVSDSFSTAFKLYAFNNITKNVSYYNNSLVMPVNLTITQTNGQANDKVNIGETINYIANSIGTGSLTATIENAAYTIEFDIIKYDPGLSVESQEIVYGSNIIIVLDYNSTATGKVNITLKGKNNNNYSFTGMDLNNTILLLQTINVDEYEVNVSYSGNEIFGAVTATANITVNKAKTVLSANAVTTVYNVNKYLVIILKDVYGNPLKGVGISVDLNGAKTYTTDANGQVKVSTKGLAPKTYTAKVTFNGDTNYEKSAKNVKVSVKKATSKITAGKKTFKAKTKVKKYAAVLKDSTGKAIKNAKLTLKVKGKTYAAKTNSKGKAVFKITKLNKKGNYKAVIKFNGDKYYVKSGKNTKITVKASKSKTTFKTVSGGSKDAKTVKKIQQALKDHGYYLTYDGHYLMIDGKYNSCTVRSVKEFQRDHGLKQTGKVDAKTAKKLGII